MINITDDMRNGIHYGGTYEKFGATINKIPCIIKLPLLGSMNVYSEYIASNFMRKLGVYCQEVHFGIYNGQLVDVIVDFTAKDGSELHTLGDIIKSGKDDDSSVEENAKDIEFYIDHYLKMPNIRKELAKQQFWNMVICDAILGNIDRHVGNLGYLSKNGQHTLAPLYDNSNNIFYEAYMIIDEYRNPSTRKELMHKYIHDEKKPFYNIKKPDGSVTNDYYEMFTGLSVDRPFAKAISEFKSKFTWQNIFEVIHKVADRTYLPIDYINFCVEYVTIRYRCIILRDDFDTAFNEVEELLW